MPGAGPVPATREVRSALGLQEEQGGGGRRGVVLFLFLSETATSACRRRIPSLLRLLRLLKVGDKNSTRPIGAQTFPTFIVAKHRLRIDGCFTCCCCEIREGNCIHDYRAMICKGSLVTGRPMERNDDIVCEIESLQKTSWRPVVCLRIYDSARDHRLPAASLSKFLPRHQPERSDFAPVEEATVSRNDPMQNMMQIFNRDHHGVTCVGFFGNRSHFLVALDSLSSLSRCRIAIVLSGKRLETDHRAKISTNVPWRRASPVVGDPQWASRPPTALEWSQGGACFVHLRLIRELRDHLLKLIHPAAHDVVRLSRHWS